MKCAVMWESNLSIVENKIGFVVQPLTTTFEETVIDFFHMLLRLYGLPITAIQRVENPIIFQNTDYTKYTCLLHNGLVFVETRRLSGNNSTKN